MMNIKFKAVIFTSNASKTFYIDLHKRLVTYPFLDFFDPIKTEKIKSENVDQQQQLDQEQELNTIKETLIKTNVIFFNTVSTVPDELIDFINERVNNNQLALVFHRGFTNDSALYKLGYVNHHYVNWGFSDTFILDLEPFYHQIPAHILDYYNFCGKHEEILLQFEKNRPLLQITANDILLEPKDYTKRLQAKLMTNKDLLFHHATKADYIGAVHLQNIAKGDVEKDWIILGYGKGY